MAGNDCDGDGDGLVGDGVGVGDALVGDGLVGDGLGDFDGGPDLITGGLDVRPWVVGVVCFGLGFGVGSIGAEVGAVGKIDVTECRAFCCVRPLVTDEPEPVVVGCEPCGGAIAVSCDRVTECGETANAAYRPAPSAAGASRAAASPTDVAAIRLCDGGMTSTGSSGNPSAHSRPASAAIASQSHACSGSNTTLAVSRQRLRGILASGPG